MFFELGLSCTDAFWVRSELLLFEMLWVGSDLGMRKPRVSHDTSKPKVYINDGDVIPVDLVFWLVFCWLVFNPSLFLFWLRMYEDRTLSSILSAEIETKNFSYHDVWVPFGTYTSRCCLWLYRGFTLPCGGKVTLCCVFVEIATWWKQ